MKNKSKKFIALLVICSISIIPLMGFKSEAVNNKIVYTNMQDKDSKNQVFKELKKHKVSDYQIYRLNDWINDFNSFSKDNQLSNGFEPMKGDLVDYSYFDFKKTPSYYVNCRLTSFMLMRNILNTNCKPDNEDKYLMFDLDAINEDRQISLTTEDKLNYATLFNWIPLGNAKTLNQHIRKIESALKERNIYIDNSKGMSIINVYIHSEFDNVRFVGHTGVLFDTDDGLLFVEKYGPDTPFQATKFNNRKELKKYLLARPDLYGEKTELAPIIIENTKVMNVNK